ncbi:MAG TPA: hypothetical protein VK919_05870 [Solirubrobacterales bacterium]|nr:hypothetical protein [Solirubrobacterales bacterium]
MIARTTEYLRRNAVAWLALLIAFGGTATASHLVVRASDIQKGAVRGKQIKKNVVKQKHLKIDNVARRFGSGVVGAHGTLGPVGDNVAGLASVAPLGTGDDFALPLPKRVRVRDLIARSNVNLARPVEVRLRRGTEIVLACTIATGTRTCDSGNSTAVLARGELLTVRLFAPPAPVAVGATSYELAYRITP